MGSIASGMFTDFTAYWIPLFNIYRIGDGIMMDRRDFLKTMGSAGAVLAGAGQAVARVHVPPGIGSHGVLVDLTTCVGCRKCEWACNRRNGLEEQTLASFEDASVFEEMRRPDQDRFTVVNRWQKEGAEGGSVWAKVQCMHCNDPACSSACVVTAFSKLPNGAVVYDPWRCMGCRYCMVSCPFQVPAYEYDNALTPRVRKCEFCAEETLEGGIPACVEVCPVEALTYGPREHLLKLARNRLAARPERYLDHIYGEHEVGGTAWLYIAGQEFTTLGFPELPSAAPPELTEKIQHGIFKGFIPPLALYALLGQAMWMTERRKKAEAEQELEREQEVEHE